MVPRASLQPNISHAKIAEPPPVLPVQPVISPVQSAISPARPETTPVLVDVGCSAAETGPASTQLLPARSDASSLPIVEYRNQIWVTGAGLIAPVYSADSMVATPARPTPTVKLAERSVKTVDPKQPTAGCVKLPDLTSISDRVRLPASEQGAMSCVETATYNGRKVIIKTPSSPDASRYDIKQFRAEIDALQSLKSHALSDYVVELIAYCESPLALVLEWCEGGTLSSYVTEHSNLSWAARAKLLINIGSGALALHKREWQIDEPSTFVRSLWFVVPAY